MERMIGIIVSTGTVIKDNETNKIIHEIENEDKEISLYSFAEKNKKYKKMKFNILYFCLIILQIIIVIFDFIEYSFFFRISGCLAKYYEI